MGQTVLAATTAHLTTTAAPVWVEFRCTTTAPHEVVVRFVGLPGGPVDRCAARDLLRDGLRARTDAGDVVVRPHPVDPRLATLEPGGLDGAVEVEVAVDVVRDFLTDTDALVPPGGAHLAAALVGAAAGA